MALQGRAVFPSPSASGSRIREVASTGTKNLMDRKFSAPVMVMNE
jgi:hypothetical protein